VKIIIWILIVLIFILLILLFNPGIIEFIPNSFKTTEYLNFVEKLIIPLLTLISIVVSILFFLLEYKYKELERNDKNLRKLKVFIEIFETKKNDDWIYALKVSFTNISIPNIYLSKFYISYFLHSSPDKNDFTAKIPFKMKLESGQQEEQIIKLAPIFSQEIEKGFLVVKIVITDSFDNDFFCEKIKLSKFQNSDFIKLTLDKSPLRSGSDSA
jgi:hypothetical protein